jgi:hypothetical protein
MDSPQTNQTYMSKGKTDKQDSGIKVTGELVLLKAEHSQQSGYSRSIHGMQTSNGVIVFTQSKITQPFGTCAVGESTTFVPNTVIKFDKDRPYID